MSNLSRQCCCGEGSSCSAFCCASSYAVSNFTIPYLFERIITGTPCTECFRRSYTLDLTITKNLPLVVTRHPVSSGGCCYRGTGFVTVAGTLTIEEQWLGNGPPCPPPFDSPVNATYTYSFDRQVCACITVNCRPKLDHCTGTDAPALQHTLEIGDFVVTCSHEGFEGDCDTCPTNYGPYQLRSAGARVAFSSSIDCLNAIGDKQCLGWYPPTQQLCGSGESYGTCYQNLEANLLPIGFYLGPFGIAFRPECTPGDDDDSCLDVPLPSVFLRTSAGTSTSAVIEALRVQLESPCANVDTDYDPCSTVNVAVRQQGGCPAFWSYT